MGEAAVGLRNDIERTRDAMSGTLEAIGDRVSPARQIERKWNRMRLSGRGLKDRVMGSADDMKERVMGSADDTRGWMSDRAHDASEAPAAAVQAVKSTTQGSPLLAGAVALGIGALAGALIPASRRERELLAQPARALMEPLKETLSEAGHEVADDMREPVSNAVAEVKDAARAGAQEVKDAAHEGVTGASPVSAP